MQYVQARFVWLKARPLFSVERQRNQIKTVEQPSDKGVTNALETNAFVSTLFQCIAFVHSTKGMHTDSKTHLS